MPVERMNREHKDKDQGEHAARRQMEHSQPQAAGFGPEQADLAQLQRVLGNQAVQPKLTVGAPNDIYEQEADRAAAAVMRAEVPEEEEEPLQAKHQPDALMRAEVPEEEEELQMKPLMRQGEEEEELLQAEAESGGAFDVTGDVENRIEGARGSGVGLTDSAREFFEPRFGQDFSEVTIHTGAEADTLNRAINARAFTTGQDIFFREGEYSPDSRAGRELLAHELTHVVQQGGGRDVARQVEERVQRLSVPVPGAGKGIRMGADDDSNVAITPEAVFFVGGNEASKASFAPEGREISIDLTPGTKGVLQIRFKLNFFIDNSAPFTNTAYEKWVYTEWPVEVSPLGELTISDPSPTRDSGDVPQNAQLYLGSVGLSKGTNYVQAQISLVNSTSSNFGVSGGAGIQGGVNFIAQGAISGNLGAQWGQSYSTGSPRPQDFKVNITVPPVNLQSGPVPVFGINRSTLREGAEEAVVQWYQGLPEAARKKIEAGALPIDVIGRASKTGPGPMNRELSRKRANKVAEILRDYAGSDAKIRVFARGEYEAAGEGEDASDRVVDIRVHSPTGG